MPPAASKKKTVKKSPVRDIALKSSHEEEAFSVHRIHEDDVPEVEPLDQASFVNPYADEDLYADGQDEEVEEDSDVPPSAPILVQQEPKEIVKVNFRKFVQLIASHDLEEVLKNNEQENVVLSSNLLTELAGAHDEGKEGRKTPVILLVGLAMGFVLAYILFSGK